MSGKAIKNIKIKISLGHHSSALNNYNGALKEAAARLKQAPADTVGLGWRDLPERDIADVMEQAAWLKKFDAIVHVGIGGSALGNQMLHQSMLGDYFNERAFPKFYLADNPDPAKIADIWERVKDCNFALVGVSKSGSTAETTAQFLWFKDKMELYQTAMGPIKDRIMLITDPINGVFRPYCQSIGCRSLSIPPDVGGRFSVLCAAGLISAAALGIDVQGILDGARAMKKSLYADDNPSSNPALQLAALHLYHESQGRPMSVMFPYSSRLEKFCEWYAQLWAESLGKASKGTTPVRAIGAIDQHSQVQLYVAGPDDKFYTFINLENRDDIELPKVKDEALAGLSYLSGKGFGQMLSYEAISTAAALKKAGRPVVWINITELSPQTLGGLIFFYEYLTAVTGYAMDIDPFDQPGVEQGKAYTYGFMGRSGFEKNADEAKEIFTEIEKNTHEIDLGQ